MITKEDLDRWAAKAKRDMDVPCPSFGPDVVAWLIEEVRELQAKLSAVQSVANAALAVHKSRRRWNDELLRESPDAYLTLAEEVGRLLDAKEKALNNYETFLDSESKS